MDKNKQTRLEAAGWKVGDTREFLGLNPEESAYIDLKLRLAKDLQKRRLTLKLSQTELAQRIHSSQSRVAKMEAGDSTVSVDLIIRALIALGTTGHQLRKKLPV